MTALSGSATIKNTHTLRLDHLSLLSASLFLQEGVPMKVSRAQIHTGTTCHHVILSLSFLVALGYVSNISCERSSYYPQLEHLATRVDIFPMHGFELFFSHFQSLKKGVQLLALEGLQVLVGEGSCCGGLE